MEWYECMQLTLLLYYALDDDVDDAEPKVGDAIPNSVRGTWDKLCVTSKHQVSAWYSIIGQLGIAISDPSVAASRQTTQSLALAADIGP
jgi:hypothetical protein